MGCCLFVKIRRGDRFRGQRTVCWFITAPGTNEEIMKHSTTRTQNINHVFRRPWMRVFPMVLLPVILASAVWGQTAAQQTGVPKLVQVKGVLKDQDGKPLTGVQRVTCTCR